MKLHFSVNNKTFSRGENITSRCQLCEICQNQKVFQLWAGEFFVLHFIPCVCFLLYMLKGARAFQSSFLVEVIATGKCKQYEASTTPDSLFFSPCRRLCVWLWHLIKINGWWWGERKEKVQKKDKQISSWSHSFVVRPVCLDHSFSEETPLSKMLKW